MIIIVSGIAYFIGMNNSATQILPTPTVTTNKSSIACTEDAKLCPDGKTYVGRIAPNCDFAPCPNNNLTVDNAHPDWKLYKNEMYGFQIFHPASYKVLNDKENLYGWPDAIVLLYKGGQSYDLPIEVWDSKAEYVAKYKDDPRMTVKEVKGKYITLFNMNTVDEVNEIIATFKVIE